MPENIKPRISIPKPIKILQADGSVKKGQLIVYKFKSKQGGVTINSIKERAKEIKAKKAYCTERARKNSNRAIHTYGF